MPSPGRSRGGDAKAKIAEYLSQFFPVHDLKDDDDIFELGLATSMFAMQLIAFVEQEFDVTVEKEDLDLEYFRSINAVDSFVDRKLPPAA